VILVIPLDEDVLVRIVEKASPWVVNISVSKVQDAYMNAAPVQGMGSGIIVDGAGYVLTNNHIVENTDAMVVSSSADPCFPHYRERVPYSCRHEYHGDRR
jgi:S1-C subfamily serine protease